MAWQKFPMYFLWSTVLFSLCTSRQIIGSCYCTFPMTKIICTCLLLLSVCCTNYHILKVNYSISALLCAGINGWPLSLPWLLLPFTLLRKSMSDDSAAAETNAAVYLVYQFAMFHQSFPLPSLRNYYMCFSKLSGILCSLVSIYRTWEKFGK